MKKERKINRTKYERAKMITAHQRKLSQTDRDELLLVGGPGDAVGRVGVPVPGRGEERLLEGRRRAGLGDSAAGVQDRHGRKDNLHLAHVCRRGEREKERRRGEREKERERKTCKRNEKKYKHRQI